ncbi:hypothetical protein, partial [Salmonella sp. s55962]|uniref:hypothetical protein n=1 Tax=Salmonella sp. s55962 TaxID=3159685 RepID=UPI00397EB339
RPDFGMNLLLQEFSSERKAVEGRKSFGDPSKPNSAITENSADSLSVNQVYCWDLAGSSCSHAIK